MNMLDNMLAKSIRSMTINRRWSTNGIRAQIKKKKTEISLTLDNRSRSAALLPDLSKPRRSNSVLRSITRSSISFFPSISAIVLVTTITRETRYGNDGSVELTSTCSSPIKDHDTRAIATGSRYSSLWAKDSTAREIGTLREFSIHRRNRRTINIGTSVVRRVAFRACTLQVSEI